MEKWSSKTPFSNSLVLFKSNLQERPLVQGVVSLTPLSIYIDEIEFLKSQERAPLLWFKYIDDIFFI